MIFFLRIAMTMAHVFSWRIYLKSDIFNENRAPLAMILRNFTAQSWLFDIILIQCNIFDAQIIMDCFKRLPNTERVIETLYHMICHSCLLWAVPSDAIICMVLSASVHANRLTVDICFLLPLQHFIASEFKPFFFCLQRMYEENNDQVIEYTIRFNYNRNTMLLSWIN